MLHRMAKVDDDFDTWQCSQILRASQKERHAQKQQTTGVGYIPDTEEIVQASWSHFQHNCKAALKLSEKSPVPRALSAKNLPGGRTQVLNVSQIRQIDRHSAESDQDSSPESISDTENGPNWNGALDNPNDSEDDWDAENGSDIELDIGGEG